MLGAAADIGQAFLKAVPDLSITPTCTQPAQAAGATRPQPGSPAGCQAQAQLPCDLVRSWPGLNCLQPTGPDGPLVPSTSPESSVIQTFTPRGFLWSKQLPKPEQMFLRKRSSEKAGMCKANPSPPPAGRPLRGRRELWTWRLLSHGAFRAGVLCLSSSYLTGPEVPGSTRKSARTSRRGKSGRGIRFCPFQPGKHRTHPPAVHGLSPRGSCCFLWCFLSQGRNQWMSSVLARKAH